MWVIEKVNLVSILITLKEKIPYKGFVFFQKIKLLLIIKINFQITSIDL